MAKSRSPQYPIIGLEEAINKARLVWENDYQSELPRDVIAEHMGYRSLNGKSLGILSTVGKFGLLEGRGEKTHITDLAVSIFAHEQGTPERAEAISRAAREPQLFRDIYEKFDGRSPSDQALKSYLITRGFTLSAVEAVIHSYRDTEAFVKQESGGRDPSPNEDESVAVMQVETSRILPTSPPPAVHKTGVPTISMSDNGLEISGGVISTIEQFDKLMRRLKAGKALLDIDESDAFE